jgi:hypothetical protein
MYVLRFAFSDGQLLLARKTASILNLMHNSNQLSSTGISSRKHSFIAHENASCGYYNDLGITFI